jgi:hypothetical protein
LGLWTGFGGLLPDWSAALLWIVAALLLLTIANRVRAALREIDGAQKAERQ